MRKFKQGLAFSLFKFFAVLVVGILFSIVFFILFNGIKVINWEFLTKSPSNGMLSGGIFPAIIGTIYLIIGSIIFAVPFGVSAAIYNIEYGKNNWFVKIMRIMTNNLAGVPSIIFGLVGMALFVNKLNFGPSLISGALTLAILILPLIIRTTEEALKSVPEDYRTSSYSLGASKLTTIRKVVLPAAIPNILTGIVLSIGRVSGETAPILFTVAAYFLPHLPQSIYDQAMALPYHLYVLVTSGTDLEASRSMAYGTALVLVAIVFAMNLLAGFFRNKMNKLNKRNS
ncbi:MAG TPA: phosphate ABC transporter permease PstA [Chitinophagaceae bacterium]|nr:phosphate ABC transporter permease PstA [Chitinophagaceae bacterium]